jgi:2-C-methyl-D-erythritol 4-phosphate cytidylyltransferase/2-C-methyl-D-erythritol 2,4-cyclodiphosphate synthase
MSGTLAIVVAAGGSARLGGATPKQFLDLGGRSVTARAIDALTSAPGIDGVIVVVPASEIDGPRATALRAIPRVSALVAGGATRMASSLAGVEAAASADVVLVHDAARPFVDPALVAAVLDATRRHGAAVPVLPASDTIKREDAEGFVQDTLDRRPLRLAQTPQGARREWMLEALRLATGSGVEVTDESEALERAGRRVAVVPGDPANMKITTPADWGEAVRRVEGAGDAFRIGHGYDVHRFGESRALVLGGVPFPGERGLIGHSDADVVLHAAMDALLGAAGLPDIGHFFPPSDPRVAGADSAALAREIAGQIRGAGLRIVNLDLTVLAERPKIAEHVGAMRASIAACLGTDPGRVGVKATTLEGLGALGRSEGIACHAVALLARVAGCP